jgi:type IV pilus assembly protein PilM
MQGPEGAEMGSSVDLSGVAVAGPTGPGWVVELQGYHFYNDPKADRRDIGSGHVRKTLLKQLKDGVVNLPAGPGQPPMQFTMKELGIEYAILAYSPRPREYHVPNPNYSGPAPGTVGGEGAPMPGGLGGLAGGLGAPAFGGIPGAPGAAPIDPDNPPFFKINKYDFAVQFVWREKPLNVRLEERRKKEEEAKAAAAAAASAAAQPADGSAPAGASAPGAAPPPPAASVPATAPVAESIAPPAQPQPVAPATPAETAPAPVSPPNSEPASGQPSGQQPGGQQSVETPATGAAP